MKPIPRDPTRWEGLQWLADLCEIDGKRITDPAALAGLADAVKRKVEEIVGDAGRVSGIAHETMFENIVVELGAAKFLKREDAGSLRSAEDVQPPDFRITLNDDRQLLVELKTMKACPEPGKGVKIPKKEFNRLVSYARLASGELWFGTFWSGMGIWTLNRPEDFRVKGKHYVLDLFPAMKANAMTDLGDAMVATTPPLTVRIVTDPAHPRYFDERGVGEYVILRRDVFCDGNLINDQRGRNLAFFMFLFGNWDRADPKVELDEDGRTILSIEWEVLPNEAVPNQELHIVGAMSELYARLFRVFTTDARGQYVRLRLPPIAGRLRTLTSDDFPFGSSGLRLWIFRLAPSPTVE